MADLEITDLLGTLADDTRRCAPVTTASIRRRGDRRRTAVRSVVASGSLAILAATTGTAYAVSSGSGSEAVVTSPAGGASSPAATAAPTTARPVAPRISKRKLEREVRIARADLAKYREKRQHLKAEHRAGRIGSRRFHVRLHSLNSRIASDRKRLVVLREELRRRQHAAAAAPRR